MWVGVQSVEQMEKELPFQVWGGGILQHGSHNWQCEANKRLCRRCGIRKNNKNEFRVCKVPTCEGVEHDEWIGFNYKVRQRWEDLWSKSAAQDEVETGVSFPFKFKRHNLIEGSKRVACLDCGKFGLSTRSCLGKYKRRWVGEACRGPRKLGKALRCLLRSGVFDEALKIRLRKEAENHLAEQSTMRVLKEAEVLPPLY